MSEDNNKIQRKLVKLMALSASPNEAEAALAMQKCREIMEKYNIRTIDVNIVDSSASVDHVTVDSYGPQRKTWEMELAGAVSTALDGNCITRKVYDNEKKSFKISIIFVASKSEVILIQDLFIRLRRTISKMSREYANSKPGSKVTLRSNYARGMAHSIYWRLKDIYNTTKPEDMALVAVKKEEVDELTTSLIQGKASRYNGGAFTDKKAYDEGFTDGKDIPLHRSVNGTRQNSLTGG